MEYSFNLGQVTIYRCSICHRTFKDYNAYKQHLRDKHKKDI